MIEWLVEIIMNPEAASTILVFFAGLVVAWIGKLLIDKRGNYVVIKHISQLFRYELVTDTSLEKIIINTLQIKNTSSFTINNLFLDISTIPNSISASEFIIPKVVVDDHENLTEVKNYFSDLEKSNLEGIYLQREYLKPFRKYRNELVELKIYSNQQIKIKIRGGGENWQSKYQDWIFPWFEVPLIGFIVTEIFCGAILLPILWFTVKNFFVIGTLIFFIATILNALYWIRKELIRLKS